MEMVSAVIGYFTASYVQNVVGYGLAFAAGAMLFIVYKELIPESHGHGFERPSTYSFIFGLLAMVYITQFLARLLRWRCHLHLPAAAAIL